MNNGYNKLIDNFKEWGLKHSDIRAILICGSYAYSNEQVYDKWSDIDLAIYCKDPSRYKINHDWLNDIHETIITFETDFFGNKDLPVIRVQFKDHLEADIGILPYEMLKIKNVSSDVLKVFHFGTKKLLDKDGLLQEATRHYLNIPLPVKNAYTKYELKQLLNELSIDIVHTSKKIARKDLYFAYLDMTNYLAERLINLIFIYHNIKYGKIKTMHDNLKNIKLWADDFILKQLEDCFPSCNIKSLWQSMNKYLSLVFNVSKEIHEICNYSNQIDALNYAKEEIAYLRENS